MNGSDPEKTRGWLILEGPEVPARWSERARPVFLIPLLEDEAESVLSGNGAGPDLDPGDEAVAKLVARGLSIEAIAQELSLSPRSVTRRLARLRDDFGVDSKAALAAKLARSGFS